jgi:hypothetical protein
MHVPSQPLGVITAFAVPDSDILLRSRQFPAALQVTLPGASPGLLQISEGLFKLIFFCRRREPS